ncbi:hypothetical protein KQX54_008296 [Cotesia glomerata]|uniref:Uncharacterized protein n=1 Tax=Cotesia glomerata TaxID=32391 RepID=A0AAV7I826_COTGL|nr:hypothetical protein KQX54_008296 [Cotesia glomerata]
MVSLQNKQHLKVDNLLKEGAHFGAINFTGIFAGFTALHHACILGDLELVTKLLHQYHVDPSVPASDGIESIQLAAFLGRFDIVLKILQFGVSVNTELTFFHFQKYTIKTQKWNANFGKKMTLFTYAIFNHHSHTQCYCYSKIMLIHYQPKLAICDKNNKTLLMHAIENDLYCLMTCMLSILNVKEINQRDDQNFTAVHTMVLKEILKKFDSQVDKAKADRKVSCYLRELCSFGADISVMINNDEKTRPIYLAAVYGFYETVKFLISKQTFFMELSRPLFYVIQSCNEYTANNSLLIWMEPYQKLADDKNGLLWIDTSYMKTIEVIIEEIYVRSLYGYPVRREEVKLMEQLVDENHIIKKLVQKLKTRYQNLESEMEKIEVRFGENKMSIYEAFTASQKKYIQIAKSNEDDDFEVNVCPPENISIFLDFIRERLQATRDRISVIEKWKVIAGDMMISLLLPYDCVLNVVKYLNNDDLQSLIEAH